MATRGVGILRAVRACATPHRVGAVRTLARAAARMRAVPVAPAASVETAEHWDAMLAGVQPLFAERDAWSTRIEQARRVLAEPRARARVAVVGTAGSGADEVVRALEAEPLDGVDLELVPLLDAEPAPEVLTALYACDAVYLVTDMAALRSPTDADAAVPRLAAQLADKPGTSLLVNLPYQRTTDPSAPGAHPDFDAVRAAVQRALGAPVLEQLARSAPPTMGDAGAVAPGIRIVSSALACEALARLSDADAHTSEFASMYAASRFTPLVHALCNVAQQTADEAHVPLAKCVVRNAHDEAAARIGAENDLIRAVVGHAQVLEAAAEHDLARHAAQVYPAEPEAAAAAPRPAVRRGDASTDLRAAVADSRHLVERTFAGRFAWWKLLWRVDELRTTLAYAVGRSFGTNEETQLAYEAGRLLGVAAAQQQHALGALDDIGARERRLGASAARFDAATLRNALASFDQAQLAPVLTSTCLSWPIANRRQQLLSERGPIDQATRQAQRLVLSTHVLLGGTYAVTGYAAFFRPAHLAATVQAAPAAPSLAPNVPPLAQVPATAWTPWITESPPVAWLAELISMSPSTAGAVALFATVLCAWRMQGAWARIKRHFWRQWEHTVHALDRDLRTELDTVLRTKVFGAPLYTARALRDAAGIRRAALERQEEQLRVMGRQLRSEPPAALGAAPDAAATLAEGADRRAPSSA